MTENEIATWIVDCAYRIHTTLGPGLLESVYEEVMCYELIKAEIKFAKQQAIPVIYNDIKLEMGFRADFIIADKVIHRDQIHRNISARTSQTIAYLFKAYRH